MAKINNILIPKHRKLDKSEISSILKKFSLDNSLKLPKIKLKDPALVDLDVQLGDVIEITRTSFAGSNKYYRVVINN